MSQFYGVAVRGVTRDALRVLEQYPWRGNVRELEAVLEQAAIFKRGEWLAADDLDLPLDRGAIDGAEQGGAAALNWLQREAMRIVSEQREVRRRDVIARCWVSREVARRELAGLVRLGLLRRMGLGRGARYVRVDLSPRS
ncbi:MAG TPA: hypothetical protein VGR43_09800 [Dehalococcoidia bacterium]|nr:hypothetical protein [Dehalococcoidia bacterium]